MAKKSPSKRPGRSASARKVGPTQIVLGGDYPVGEDNPAAFVKGAKLSSRAKRMILGENAAKLLGIAA